MVKIYTRKGDDGSTSLWYGGRVKKTDPRTEAYGSIDEANSALGMARALCKSENQGELQVLKDIAPAIKALGDGTGKGVLVIDDLTDTGKTAKIVRDMLPNAHFAAVYAKPAGRPLIDTFVTEVSQDTWIYFPWDMGLAYQAPIREGSAG